MKVSLLLLSLPYVLSACDPSGSSATSDVAGEVDTKSPPNDLQLVDVMSAFTTCSSLGSAGLEFDIRNVSALSIQPRQIVLQTTTGNMTKSFSGAPVIAPGAVVHFECTDTYGGPGGSGTETSNVELTYDIDGDTRVVTARGTHSRSQLFDNCDTGMGEITVTECHVVAAPTP